MKRQGTAIWHGDLKKGDGTLSTESGAVSNAHYSFAKRFETEKGTNPEELIAAAHAACFSMAYSGDLAKAGVIPESVQTTASVNLQMLDSGPTVTDIHLDVIVNAPGADMTALQKIADGAKANCPISRLLSGSAKITMSLKTA